MGQNTVSADPICDVLLRLRALAGLSLRQVERGDWRPTVEAARALLDFYGYDLVVVRKDGES